MGGTSFNNSRAVDRSENLGVPEAMWSHNPPPLSEIGLTDIVAGLTDVPKSRRATAPPAPPVISGPRGGDGYMDRSGGRDNYRVRIYFLNFIVCRNSSL